MKGRRGDNMGSTSDLNKERALMRIFVLFANVELRARYSNSNSLVSSCFKLFPAPYRVSETMKNYWGE